MESIAKTAEEISEQFENNGVDLNTDEIRDRLVTLHDEYSVPVKEAHRSVVTHYVDEHGLDPDAFWAQTGAGGNDQVGCGTIEAAEEWIDMEVQVVDLWEPRHESIAQVGLLGDKTGTIKFVAFETSELEALDEEASYCLENVVTDEYNGNYSVKLNSTTQITPLEGAVEVGDSTTTRSGQVVSIQPGSGLIKRCPIEDCTAALRNGRCYEHGDVKGKFDLRTKAVLDDGRATRDVLFDREQTESLIGMTLDETVNLAREEMNSDVISERIAEEIIGRYLTVSGPNVGQYLLVDKVGTSEAPTTDEIEALYESAA